MVVFVAGQWRSPAFNRIGEKDGGALIIDGVKGRGQRRQAMAAKIVHQIRQFIVGSFDEQFRDIALVANVFHQALAPSCTAHKGQS